MSILNRLIPNRHVTDAVLAEIWADSAFRQAQGRPEEGRGTAAGAVVAHPHLQSCDACLARYSEFCAWADALRDEDLAAADAAFTVDRLAAQQSQILRRLETLERPARVIAFPKFAQPTAGTRSVAYRWVAAAAAAGLVIGVALGHWLDLSHRFNQPVSPIETQMVTSAPPAADTRLQTVNAISDEALLSDLEDAVAMQPSVGPLRAIDAITPRSRDFVRSRR